MEHLRDSVRLRAFGQKDPLVEYKREGHKLFRELLKTFERTVFHFLLQASIKTKEAVKTAEESVYVPSGRKIGRNDPCPCGSGKKYKKCCWPKYG